MLKEAIPALALTLACHTAPLHRLSPPPLPHEHTLPKDPSAIQPRLAPTYGDIVWEKRKVNVWRQRYAAPNEARIGRALRVRDHRSSFEVLVALRRLPAFLTVMYGALWSKGTEKDFRAKWSEDGGEVRAKRYLFAFTGETEAKTKAK
ncbi:hypothetical protein K525DRAFT_247584 [Schizophyllum commune Loenen D]|nr:hypothetical protein K525DRAFT_247584 [Schizophyllum commune Loenen D]